MDIRFRNKSKSGVISDYRLRKLAVRVPTYVLELENHLDDEVSIVFIDDEEMRELNMQYRAKDKPTDILSFRLNEGEFAGISPNVLGDIAISLPIAERQAKEYGTSIDVELARLLIHGTLHLLGYDHIAPRDAKVMMPLQEQLLVDACKKLRIK